MPAMTLPEIRTWARVGVISALALVFSYIETFIPLPIPVPGIKLGLANVAVLLALELLDLKSATLVAAIKVLAAGLLFGNPVMMLYSAGGTVLAFGAMALITRIDGASPVLAAVAGAIMHNLGQLAVASLILGTPLVWANAPILVIAACITGALSGVATKYALGALESDLTPANAPETHSASLAGESGRSESLSPGRPTRQRSPKAPAGGGQGNAPTRNGRLDARAKLALLVIFVVAALHASEPLAVGACALVALACAARAKLDWPSLRAMLRPLAPIVIITVAMQVLYLQQGQVVLQLGALAVTDLALAASVRMLVILAAIMTASVSFMRTTTTEELLAGIRWMLVPLRALGMRTEAFMFSLSVAFRFIPVLAKDFEQVRKAQLARAASFEGNARKRLSAYTRLFAPLVRSSFRRADSLAEAAASRSFGCTPSPTALRAYRFEAKDAIALILALACAAAIIVFG